MQLNLHLHKALSDDVHVFVLQLRSIPDKQVGCYDPSSEFESKKKQKSNNISNRSQFEFNISNKKVGYKDSSSEIFFRRILTFPAHTYQRFFSFQSYRDNGKKQMIKWYFLMQHNVSTTDLPGDDFSKFSEISHCQCYHRSLCFSLSWSLLYWFVCVCTWTLSFA